MSDTRPRHYPQQGWCVRQSSATLRYTDASRTPTLRRALAEPRTPTALRKKRPVRHFLF
ncbi:MAG: hypothetical protein K2H72_08610 [Muribaculaceae bacterium]|nr:hypothetical protein [Muribaculaceae bacterium]